MVDTLDILFYQYNIFTVITRNFCHFKHFLLYQYIKNHNTRKKHTNFSVFFSGCGEKPSQQPENYVGAHSSITYQRILKHI